MVEVESTALNAASIAEQGSLGVMVFERAWARSQTAVESEAASQSSWMAGSSEVRSKVKRRRNLGGSMQIQEESLSRRLRADGMMGFEPIVEAVQRQTDLVTWVDTFFLLHSLLCVTELRDSYDLCFGCTCEMFGLTD